MMDWHTQQGGRMRQPLTLAGVVVMLAGLCTLASAVVGSRICRSEGYRTMTTVAWAPIPAAQDDTKQKQTPPPDDEAKKKGRTDELVGHEVKLERVDGQEFIGTLIKRDREAVVLCIAGINTTFDPYDVVRITRQKSFVEYFQEMRQRISKRDFDGRYSLCFWVYERGEYELAEAELLALLEDEPGYEKARTLLRQVRAAMQLNKDKEAGEGDKKDGRTDETPPGSATDNKPLLTEQQRLRSYLLDDEQINLLRVYEIDLRHPPSIQIPNRAIESLLSSYEDSELIPSQPDEQRLFYRKPATEILDIMFRLRARELYPLVRVIGEPESLNAFRHKVHRTWLVNSCASDQCHGSLATSGRLFLYDRPPTNDQVVYTNYLILVRTTATDGQPMIDFLQPEKSLLIQAGLPREVALAPHPDVPGWKPAFETITDPAADTTIEWIRMLYRPRLDDGYPVEFTPPGLMGRKGEAVVEEESTPTPPADPEEQGDPGAGCDPDSEGPKGSEDPDR